MLTSHSQQLTLQWLQRVLSFAALSLLTRHKEQLWDTTMNPEHRGLIQIKMADAIEADKIFTLLMGDAPELRRKFIEENAKLVEDLDI